MYSLPSRWSSSCWRARPSRPDPATLIRLPVAILGDDPDPFASGHVGDVAGDRQAALKVPVVAGRPDDPRVDQLVELVLDLDDAGLHRLAELRRRQADPGRVAHRVGEVVEQLVEVLAEAVDRLALEAQARVAKEDDRSDAHRPEYTAAAQSGPAGRGRRVGRFGLGGRR